MKHLWQFSNTYFKKSPVGMFLTINILIYAIATLLLGVFCCMIAGQFPITYYLANIMLAAIYMALIFGFFGGILYLYRH